MLEKLLYILDSQNLLLIHFDGDLKRHSINQSDECGLAARVEAQVVVRQVHGLQHCLVLAASLNCELQNRKNAFLAEFHCNFASIVFCEVVHRVVLQIHTPSRPFASLFGQHVVDAVDKLVLAELLNSLRNAELNVVLLVDFADLGAVLNKNVSDLENCLTHFLQYY